MDPPLAGSWNMAVDQALLDFVTQPVLRLYQWEVPTLTLGYFQRLADRDGHLESRGCPVLRRSTGGGAILHDCELTYSLVLPADQIQTQSSIYYDRIHQVVAEMLAEVGLVALLHPNRPPDATGFSSSTAAGQGSRHEPFLCFERRAAGDLVLWPNLEPTRSPSGVAVHGHKILGSAQRKREGAILQHGSILFHRSEKAPQLMGINDFLPPFRRENLSKFGERLAARLLMEFEWEGQVSELTGDESSRATEYQSLRFGNAAWNSMR
jgi:lipoate-protein ligase A